MNPSEAAWFLFLQPKYESQREAAMGYCTRAEFMEGCRNLGVNLGPLQVESLFSCLDLTTFLSRWRSKRPHMDLSFFTGLDRATERFREFDPSKWMRAQQAEQLQDAEGRRQSRRESELKGSISEGPNHSNFSDRSSIRILSKVARKFNFL